MDLNLEEHRYPCYYCDGEVIQSKEKWKCNKCTFRIAVDPSKELTVIPKNKKMLNASNITPDEYGHFSDDPKVQEICDYAGETEGMYNMEQNNHDETIGELEKAVDVIRTLYVMLDEHDPINRMRDFIEESGIEI